MDVTLLASKKISEQSEPELLPLVSTRCSLIEKLRLTLHLLGGAFLL